MRRGWRNDPRWVEHYKQRDAERYVLFVEKMRLEHDEKIREIRSAIRENQAAIKYAPRLMNGQA